MFAGFSAWCERRGSRCDAALGIGARGQIASIEHRGNARNIAWNASACRSKCSFTCSSKDSGTPAGATNPSVFSLAGGFLGEFQPPFDFANVGLVFVQPRAIAGAEILLEAGQALRDRIENAAILLPARGALFRSVPPEPNRRSKATCGSSSIGSGWVGEAHEIEFE